MARLSHRYKNIPSDAYKVDSGLAANIRFIKGSHFEIGADKREQGASHFVTLKEHNYRPHDIVEQAALNVGRAMDLRSSHFKVGNEDEKIYTLNQVNYGDKTKFMPKERFVTKNLRESHFKLGTAEPSFVSHNMVQYRNPALT